MCHSKAYHYNYIHLIMIIISKLCGNSNYNELTLLTWSVFQIIFWFWLTDHNLIHETYTCNICLVLFSPSIHASMRTWGWGKEKKTEKKQNKSIMFKMYVHVDYSWTINIMYRSKVMNCIHVYIRHGYMHLSTRTKCLVKWLN